MRAVSRGRLPRTQLLTNPNGDVSLSPFLCPSQFSPLVTAYENIMTNPSYLKYFLGFATYTVAMLAARCMYRGSTTVVRISNLALR